jgi:UPF0176 protein
MCRLNTISNIAAYRFVELSDVAQWRESIRSQGEALGLKGTVLLATEGINLVLAGQPAATHAFLAWLQHEPRFADIAVKESFCTSVPFQRLRVKLKTEIIRMNHPTIRPQARRAPVVDATTLARWLAAGHDDTGRPVVTLDTRNAFEVDRGRFRGAITWRITKFSEFPQALLAHREALRGKTVVSYCTGGIRCEKAALFMQDAGVDHVFQLDGGILNYFEVSGGSHFDGDCFVFDARDTLDKTLLPTASPPGQHPDQVPTT